jgi:hypothetical protein
MVGGTGFEPVTPVCKFVLSIVAIEFPGLTGARCGQNSAEKPHFRTPGAPYFELEMLADLLRNVC